MLETIGRCEAFMMAATRSDSVVCGSRRAFCLLDTRSNPFVPFVVTAEELDKVLFFVCIDLRLKLKCNFIEVKIQFYSMCLINEDIAYFIALTSTSCNFSWHLAVDPEGSISLWNRKQNIIHTYSIIFQ